jgi:hypothetical protein
VEEVVVDILLDHKLLVVEHSCHFAARLAGGETMRCRRTTCLFGAEKKKHAPNYSFTKLRAQQ